MMPTLKILTSFIIPVALVAPACDSDSGPSQREILEQAIDLVGLDTIDLFMACEGDGPSSVEQSGIGNLFMEVIDQTRVHVEPQRGCVGIANVIQNERRDDDTRLISLAVPAITCPFPHPSVSGEVWTATLSLEPTVVFLTVFSNEDGIYATKVNSIWNGEVIRTGSGNAVCEYTYLFPGL